MTPQQVLERVRRVEIRTNRLVTDTMVGAYLSRFKGRGMDFEELREYLPGDDVRDIDWNVTNRMGRPFVKRYREERELVLTLLADISASSRFGSVESSKRDLATEVAAALALSAARSGDKVSLLLFTDQIELHVPPRKGRRHILRILRELVGFRPRGRGTGIATALDYFNRVAHRRSLAFLLTDFLHCLSGAERGGLMSHETLRQIGLTNARHDLVCVHLTDARECELPAAGLVTVEDSETGETVELDSGRPAVRRNYAAVNQCRLEELDGALRLTGVDTLRFRTTDSIVPMLQRFFETRRSRRSG